MLTLNDTTEQFDMDGCQHLFISIQHAQETATEWLWRYNNERPNMALGGTTPIQKLKEAA